jgi:SAM-dependent methyltransferase
MNDSVVLDEYKSRVEQQIHQYESVVDMHQLPAAFHYWSYHHLRPALSSVFGIESVAEFYATGFQKASSGKLKPRFLSVGCGDGWLEIEVANLLRAKGMDFEFIAADLSPIMLDRFRAALPESLTPFLFPMEHDLNSISIEGRFDGVMANHSLHHFVDLEHIFDYIKERLDGIFATNDMIGRNGHMRWPESLAIVRSLWPMLSESQQVNAQLLRSEPRFLNTDCSTEGFEGIRAQDILPLLIERFNVSGFVGAGGVTDVFIDRAFGHGLDMNSTRDVGFVKAICDLNDILLDSGLIKPTVMFGYFTNGNEPTSFYRGRTPEFSIREPNLSVGWTKYYDVEK